MFFIIFVFPKDKMILRSAFIFFTIILTSYINATPIKKLIDGVTYYIVEANYNSVKIIWKDSKGHQLHTFSEVGRYLLKQGYTAKTLMNGGIFEPGWIPTGLLIQNGKVIRPINRRKGEGNFYLKPNGIFMITSKGASVIDAAEDRYRKDKIHYAVQSGPMLLKNAKVHPAFNANSKSRLHRNGVGILRNGKVVFAMTDTKSAKFPNLYEFSQLFRQLGCENALFLDGNISQMKSGRNIFKANSNLGAVIAIVGTNKKDN